MNKQPSEMTIFEMVDEMMLRSRYIQYLNERNPFLTYEQWLEFDARRAQGAGA